VAAVEAWLSAVPGVSSVHDVHVWAMSTTENAMTAHLVMTELPAGALACELDAKLRAAFKVHHVALQLDPEGASCALAGDHAT